MTPKKKLIEVALPLEAINQASAREKSIRHGHPSTLHLWWARRPLAAARAVIFAQMVDDPSAHLDLFPTEEAQEQERQRLFRIIEQLVKWENTTNEPVLQAAREEIAKSWRRTCAENADHPRAAELFNPDKLPAFHDPFCGGGSIPLEAQRLGLEAYASDLNPVAVLITKAMIEIPPRFAGLPPVNPAARQDGAFVAREWKGAQGLAEDVRYYGKWMRDEAERRIGHLYPKVRVAAAAIEGSPPPEQPASSSAEQPPVARAASPLAPLHLDDGEGGTEDRMAPPTAKPGRTVAAEAAADSPLATAVERGSEGEAARTTGGCLTGDEAAPSTLNLAQRRELCRQLRQSQTPAEQTLWELLRDRRFEGWKFRRQYPIGGFVTDFSCPEARLIIELDGGIHADPEQRARDQARDAEIARHGYQILRIPNVEVLDHPETALDRIRGYLTPDPEPSHHPPARSASSPAEAASPSAGLPPVARAASPPRPSPLRWRGEDRRLGDSAGGGG